VLVGRNLSDTYRVVRSIAHGGMGAIYQATHLRLAGKRYAIKVLTPRYATDPEVLARFRREAEITSQLAHEHIIEIHDFNVEGSMAYLVMELLEGEDLAARLRRRGMLEIDVVIRIVEQLSSALDAAHRARIVHRDLKPNNIFLCNRDGRDDYVKVLDFGVSKVLDSSLVLTRQDALLGTPYYMAPEQAEGRIDEIDARTDVFALAAIAWEMLAGKRAFDGPTLAAVLYNVCLVDPPEVHHLRREVPPAASQALRRALAKNRAARTDSVMAFAHELADALANAPPSARPRLALGFASTELSGGIRAAAATVASLPGGAAPAVPPAPGSGMPPGAESSPARGASSVGSQIAWQPAATGAGGSVVVPGSEDPAQIATGSLVVAPRPRFRRVWIMATVVVAAALAGIWVVAGPPRTASEPAAAVSPAKLAVPEPPPAATPPPRDDVSLAFTVEPATAGVELRLDGQTLTERQLRRARSQTPIIVTANAAGYLPFRSEITADHDQTVRVTLRPSPDPHSNAVTHRAPVAKPPARAEPRPRSARSPTPASLADVAAPTIPGLIAPSRSQLPSAVPVVDPSAPAPRTPGSPAPAPTAYPPRAPSPAPAPSPDTGAPAAPIAPPVAPPPAAAPAKKTGTVFDQ